MDISLARDRVQRPNSGNSVRSPRAWLLPIAAAGLLTSTAFGQLSLPTSGAVPLPGVVKTEQRHDQREFGDPWNNPDIGGSASVSADLRRTYFKPSRASASPSASNYRAEARLESDVEIFGSTLEAARFAAMVENEPYLLSPSGASLKPSYVPSATAYLELAGFTVLDADVDLFEALSHTFHWNLGTYDIPIVQFPVPLGPLVITVQVHAGVTANVALTAKVNLGGAALDLSGTASGSTYGAADALLGGPGLGAGVSARLDFVNPTLTQTLHASVANGLSASLRFCVTPIVFRLFLFAHIGWGKLKKIFEKELYRLAMDQHCIDLF